MVSVVREKFVRSVNLSRQCPTCSQGTNIHGLAVPGLSSVSPHFARTILYWNTLRSEASSTSQSSIQAWLEPIHPPKYVTPALHLDIP